MTAAQIPKAMASAAVAPSMTAGSSSSALATPQRCNAGRKAMMATRGSHCVAMLNLPWNDVIASGVANAA
jgi:hypothetical protein